MRRRRLVPVLVACCAALPVLVLPPAGASATPAPVPASPLAGALAGLGRAGVPEQVLAAARLQLTADAADRRTTTGSAAAPPAGPAPQLLPLGDLDGNGSNDVLDVRYRTSSSGVTGMALVARSGVTGRVVWQRLVPVAARHFAFALPARTGTAGRAGAAVYDLSFDATSGGAPVVSSTLTGLAGRTGATLWSHRDSGTASSSGTTQRSSVALLQGDLAGSRTSQFLVVRQDVEEVGGVAGTSVSGRVTAFRVSGADGTVVRVVGPVESGDAVPQAQALPDLSGDGVDDVAVLQGGEQSEVRVVSGTDGGPVWSHTGTRLHDDAGLQPVGTVTGAQRGGRPVPDLGLSTGTAEQPDGDPSGGSLPAPGTAPAHGSVLLLAGDDGRQVLTVTGDRAVALERAGEARVPALGVATADVTEDDSTVRVALTVSAYDTAGTRLYTHEERVSAPATDGEGFGLAVAAPLGDLQRDGSQDVQASLVAVGDDEPVTRDVLLDGRTGSALPYGAASPLYGSLSSHGDDLVTVAPGDGVLVTGRSGRTGRPVFATRVARGTRLATATAYAADRTGGPCDDVLVSATGPGGDVSAVLRSDGRVRWSLQGPVGSATRPVTTAPVVAQRCS